jgi:hypothetical protein
MINTPVLCVPAMVAGGVARRNSDNRLAYSGSTPSSSRSDHRRYVEYYVEELEKEGFEVTTCPDPLKCQPIIRVKRGDLVMQVYVNDLYFADDLCLTHEIRELVRRVENAFAEKEKEN